MNTSTVSMTRQRGVCRRQEEEVLSRLRQATGQLGGVTSMYDDGRYCVDVLDQLSAVAAAVDGVAVLILTDHITACVHEAMDTGDSEAMVAELVTAVRPYVRSQ